MHAVSTVSALLVDRVAVGGSLSQSLTSLAPPVWALLVAEAGCDYAHKLCTSRLVLETSAFTSTLVSTLSRFAITCVAAVYLSPTLPPPSAWLGIALVVFGALEHANVMARGDANAAPGRAAGKHD